MKKYLTAFLISVFFLTTLIFSSATLLKNQHKLKKYISHKLDFLVKNRKLSNEFAELKIWVQNFLDQKQFILNTDYILENMLVSQISEDLPNGLPFFKISFTNLNDEKQSKLAILSNILSDSKNHSASSNSDNIFVFQIQYNTEPNTLRNYFNQYIDQLKTIEINKHKNWQPAQIILKIKAILANNVNFEIITDETNEQTNNWFTLKSKSTNQELYFGNVFKLTDNNIKFVFSGMGRKTEAFLKYKSEESLSKDLKTCLDEVIQAEQNAPPQFTQFLNLLTSSLQKKCPGFEFDFRKIPTVKSTKLGKIAKIDEINDPTINDKCSWGDLIISVTDLSREKSTQFHIWVNGIFETEYMLFLNHQNSESLIDGMMTQILETTDLISQAQLNSKGKSVLTIEKIETILKANLGSGQKVRKSDQELLLKEVAKTEYLTGFQFNKNGLIQVDVMKNNDDFLINLRRLSTPDNNNNAVMVICPANNGFESEEILKNEIKRFVSSD